MDQSEARSKTVHASTRLRFTHVFVGRECEISRLLGAFEDVQEGQGSFAVLVGEPGIGKSQTARELASRASRRGAVVLTGLCYEGEVMPAYGPWRAALSRYVLGADTETLVRQIGGGAAELAELIPQLHEKISGLQEARLLSSSDSRARLYESLIRFLRAIAVEQTTLIVLEDLQCADRNSLQLLEHVVNEVQESRILVLGTYREDEVGPRHPLTRAMGELVKHPSFCRIHLNGLARREVAKYLSQVTGSTPPASLVQEVHSRTDGNPLFVVEVVRHMMDSPDAAHSVPEGVRAAIRRRLDLLPSELNTILTTAGLSEEQVLAFLETAQAAGFVEELEDPSGGYRFSHVLIQETLLSELSGSRRARKHAQIAAVMEELYGPDPGTRAGELVRHLAESAGFEKRKLTHYSLMAAEHALKGYAPDEAVAVLDRALETIRGTGAVDDTDIADLLHMRGRALVDSGSTDAAESLVKAFDLYERHGRPERAVSVALTPAPHALRIGQYVTWVGATSFLRDLRERALRIVEPGSIEQARLLAGGSRKDVKRALVAAQEHGDASLQRTCHAKLAVVHCHAGRFEESAREEEMALRLGEAANDPFGVFLSYYWRRFRLVLTGNATAARRLSPRLLEIAEETRSHKLLCFYHHSCVQLAASLGNFGVCREHAHTCLDLRLSNTALFSHRISLVALAMTELETGHIDEAERVLARLGDLTGLSDVPAPFLAAKIARITGDLSRLDAADTIARQFTPEIKPPYGYWTMCCDMQLALSAYLRDDRTEAETLEKRLNTRRGRYMPTGAHGKSSDAVLGLLCLTLGRLDDAVQHFDDALEFARKGYRSELAWNHYDAACALLRRSSPGDLARAESLLEEGQHLCRELGMVPLGEMIEAVLREQTATANRAEAAALAAQAGLLE